MKFPFHFLRLSIQVKNQDIRDGPISNLFRNDFWGQDITLPDSHKSFRPLTVLSFRVNFSINGLQPFGYHATNVVIYAAVCILMWNLASLWLSSDGWLRFLESS